MRWIRAINILILLLTIESGTLYGQNSAETPSDFAVRKMREANLAPSFIEQSKRAFDPSNLNLVVELNVLGFMSRGDYSGHYSERAIRKSREFLKKHHKTLATAKKTYGVPESVIASLLWVETKHGTHVGKYKVLDVYFSLLQADHPDVLRTTLSTVAARSPASLSEYTQKATERSQLKAEWALKELKALSKIQRKRAKNVSKLLGSYAGAFGIPQFLPSSYLAWAKSHQGRLHADLFNVNDAITSVGHYLKTNGWIEADPASHQKALLHYNRAQGYVDVILKLAAAL